MATLSPSPSKTTIHETLRHRRFQKARQRSQSIRERDTSVLTREFFRGYLDDDDDDDPETRWKSLPRRVIRLATYLEEAFCEEEEEEGARGIRAKGEAEGERESQLPRNDDGHDNIDRQTKRNRQSLSIRISKSNNHESRRLALGAAIFAAAPPCFLNDFRLLFEALLGARQRQWETLREDSIEADGDEHDNDSHSDAMISDSTYNKDANHKQPMNSAMQQQHQETQTNPDDDLLQNESQFYTALAILQWLQPAASTTPISLHAPFHQALQTLTLRTIRSLISTRYDAPGPLRQTLEWTSSVLSPWVHHLLGPDAFHSHSWPWRLERLSSHCFLRIRHTELFDILAEYPDSLPAIRELTEALDRSAEGGAARTAGYRSLAQEWKKALTSRVLHPGAQTHQIIDVYVTAIKVLREMDPKSGELLQVVTRPVREYLRGRKDTVRCIVTSLTDEENGGDLYEELKRQDAKPLEEALLDEEDEEEEVPTLEWMPPPSILQRRGVITGEVGRVSSNSRRAGDILSMLVGIYGSKELFVNEYRMMLADKLLANLEYDTDREVHNLELLKLRFGEMSMRQCEVMIKDIDDSKRIFHNIRSTLENNASTQTNNDEEPVMVDAAIISHIFWPALQKEQFKNHPRIQAKIDQFSIEYAKLKNPRRLIWMKQLGTVQLEVEVYEEDEHDGILTSHVKEVTCTPAHATLLAHFEDKDRWSVDELATETGMSEELVKKRMGFWINQRVIQTTRSSSDLIYTLPAVEYVGNSNDGGSADHREHHHHDDDDEDDPNREQAISLSAHEEEEIKVYESYIVGMLSNLGQLPLERIHSMLRTFVAGSDHRYDKTPQQLAVFLQQLCKEEKLECSPDGYYKLLKKRS